MDKRIIDLNDACKHENEEFEKLLENMSDNLKIDVYNLEEDCSKHSSFYLVVALFASRAGLLQNRSELLVKELKAEIGTDIRSDPDKYGISKITEGQVFEAVDSAEYAKEARMIRAKCMKLKNDADALLQAFEHRRSMLNNEVQLFMSKLSTTSIEAKRSDTVQRLADRKIAKRLNRHE